MGLRQTVKREGNNRGDGDPPRDDGALPAATCPPPPRREAWTARGQLLLDFHHAISRAINSPEMARKCSRIAEDMSRSEEEASSRPRATTRISSVDGGASLAEEYGAEAALIVENKSTRDAALRNKSVALGIFSFAALRSGRGLSSLVRKTIANRGFGDSYQFERHLRPSQSLIKNNNSAGSAVAEAKQPSKLRRFFRLALDATISMSITLLSGAFLFMPRPSAYIEDMAKLPLVEGKSVYAEVVCPPLLREYRRVLEQYGGRWPVVGPAASGKDGNGWADSAAPQLTQEDVSLNVIRTFVENCSKRSKYERALLEEQSALRLDDDPPTFAVSKLMKGITKRNDKIIRGTVDGKRKEDINSREEANKLSTISIPSPGVPENFPVDLDRDVYSLAEDVNEEEGDGR